MFDKRLCGKASGRIAKALVDKSSMAATWPEGLLPRPLQPRPRQPPEAMIQKMLLCSDHVDCRQMICARKGAVSETAPAPPD